MSQFGEKGEPFAAAFKSYVEILLLAAGRTELAAPDEEAQVIKEFRKSWGKTISAYLAG